MSLDGGVRFGKMFVDEGSGQARPGGIVLGIDGRSPRGGNWEAGSTVQESYEVGFGLRMVSAVGAMLGGGHVGCRVGCRGIGPRVRVGCC
jgi:hypothetical protein